MKPIALLSALVAMTGCSPAGNAPTATASPGVQSAPVAAPAADTRPDDGGPSTAPASTTSDASVPSEARGIAVGEPHPSGTVPVDAGPARLDGYGDLRLGMTVDAARKAWKGTLKGDEVTAGNCAYLSPEGTAAGPYLMFEQGRFVRYDVRGANTVAPGGGRVGLAADEIRRMYAGRVEEQPHHYVEGGRYLRVSDPATKGRALLFEVDEHGRVTTWRVGQAPQVDYVEGCA